MHTRYDDRGKDSKTSDDDRGKDSKTRDDKDCDNKESEDALRFQSGHIKEGRWTATIV